MLGLLPSADNALFDASQYAFFSQYAMEEVELGGLADDDGDRGFVGLDDEENKFPSVDDREVTYLYLQRYLLHDPTEASS